MDVPALCLPNKGVSFEREIRLGWNGGDCLPHEGDPDSCRVETPIFQFFLPRCCGAVDCRSVTSRGSKFDDVYRTTRIKHSAPIKKGWPLLIVGWVALSAANAASTRWCTPAAVHRAAAS